MLFGYFQVPKAISLCLPKFAKGHLGPKQAQVYFEPAREGGKATCLVFAAPLPPATAMEKKIFAKKGGHSNKTCSTGVATESVAECRGQSEALGVMSQLKVTSHWYFIFMGLGFVLAITFAMTL